MGDRLGIPGVVGFFSFSTLFNEHRKQVRVTHFDMHPNAVSCLRPYHVEYTSSRPITEAKQRWAWLVLGWVTAWEYQVL